MNIKWYKMLIGQSNLHNYFSDFFRGETSIDISLRSNSMKMSDVFRSVGIIVEWGKEKVNQKGEKKSQLWFDNWRVTYGSSIHDKVRRKWKQ